MVTDSTPCFVEAFRLLASGNCFVFSGLLWFTRVALAAIMGVHYQFNGKSEDDISVWWSVKEALSQIETIIIGGHHTTASLF